VTQLVKIELVAEKLSVTVENVQQLVRDRQIPAVRLSRKLWRFDLEKVQAAVAKLEIRPR
jgi:excisionase family DNA binding protein